MKQDDCLTARLKLKHLGNKIPKVEPGWPDKRKSIVSVLLHLSRMVSVVLKVSGRGFSESHPNIGSYDCFVMARSFKVSKW